MITDFLSKIYYSGAFYALKIIYYTFFNLKTVLNFTFRTQNKKLQFLLMSFILLVSETQIFNK